ncbi:MAG: TIGR02647 family protein [Methylococcales bacterium]|jgi:uncharacterized protein (TIGR02647 family)|nr:TIGR02647 family protein [Methylococcales bacterium]
MPYNKSLVDELNILIRYNLNTTLEGIKVHKTATTDNIAATKRLFDKGLITHEDGGYLTNLGHDAAEQAQTVLNLLNPA